MFIQAKEEHPELTKPQLYKMIGKSDSSLKRIMKNLNMKSFYRHEVPVNRKKIDITVNKKINTGTKKLSLRCGIANTKCLDLYPLMTSMEFYFLYIIEK